MQAVKRYSTFALAEIAAVGTYLALAVLVTHVLTRVVTPKRFPSEQLFALAIIYDGLPGAFLCGLLGGLIVRGSPIVFGIVLVIVTRLLAIFATPSLLTGFHFWMEMSLSFAAALCGAVLATSVMSWLGEREPVRPGSAALAGFLVMVVAWALTIYVTIAV